MAIIGRMVEVHITAVTQLGNVFGDKKPINVCPNRWTWNSRSSTCYEKLLTQNGGITVGAIKKLFIKQKTGLRIRYLTKVWNFYLLTAIKTTGFCRLNLRSAWTIWFPTGIPKSIWGSLQRSTFWLAILCSCNRNKRSCGAWKKRICCASFDVRQKFRTNSGFYG